MYALILMLAALAYWTETVRVPLTMAAQSEKPMCCNMSGHTACGGMIKKASATDGPAAPEKCNGRNCGNTADCQNCPLCYMATPPASWHAGILYPAFISDYAAMPAGTPTDYASPSWKPPDAGSFTYGPFII